MAISPAPTSSGPLKEIGNVMKEGTEKARRKRTEPEENTRRVERQRVREQGPSRRAREEAAAERARERRAEQERGGRLDVRA